MNLYYSTIKLTCLLAAQPRLPFCSASLLPTGQDPNDDLINLSSCCRMWVTWRQNPPVAFLSTKMVCHPYVSRAYRVSAPAAATPGCFLGLIITHFSLAPILVLALVPLCLSRGTGTGVERESPLSNLTLHLVHNTLCYSGSGSIYKNFVSSMYKYIAHIVGLSGVMYDSCSPRCHCYEWAARTACLLITVNIKVQQDWLLLHNNKRTTNLDRERSSMLAVRCLREA